MGEKRIRLSVDISEIENNTLGECIDAVNQKLFWLEENQSVIVAAILDENFSSIQEWTSEILTREDFARTLELLELAISFKWNLTMIDVGCNQDYFSGHCFCVYVNEKNEITGCGLEG